MNKLFISLFVLLASPSIWAEEFININKVHKNLFSYELTDLHKKISKNTKISLEEIIAIEASLNPTDEIELTQLVKEYKKIHLAIDKEIHLFKKSFVPVEVSLGKYFEKNTPSKLELLKFYKFYTNLSIKIDDDFFQARNLNSIKEFETYDIYINANLSLSKINQFASAVDLVLPTKLSMKKIENNVTFFLANFLQLQEAKNNIKKMLKKNYTAHTSENLEQLKIHQTPENFGVVYFVENHKSISGAMVLDRQSGKIIEIILI